MYMYIGNTIVTNFLRNFLAAMHAFNYSRHLDTNTVFPGL
jgi:hypothetical protein